jgi:ornithine cyclodeaminase/alanine dehydrogenase-like protein (mu-crystallin family)
MDGGCITSIRTGAAGAVAAKYLARSDTEVVAVLGAGTQGRAQLRGLVEVRSVKNVKVYDELGERAEVYCREMSAELPRVEIEVSTSAQQAVEGADIIVTATPSTCPIVLDEWVTRGVHINAMGADAPGKQELDARLLPRAKVVVDRLSQCCTIGECQHALSLGLISRDDIYAEIGEVTAGRKPGRESGEEITIFDGTGVAIQDVAVAALVYEMASNNGLGTEIALYSV